MPHKHETPESVRALGRGDIAGSGELETSRFYAETVPDETWEAAVLAVITIAGGDTERGERARRAVHSLCGQPYVSRPVWTAAQGVAWTFIAAIVSGDADLRARANALIKQVLALAAEAQRELGRAA